MRRLRAIVHRVRGIFRRRTLEAEMQAEMQAHLDALTDRNLAAGMSAEDARHAALRAFGGVEQIKERARDERRSLWVEQLGQDLRYAVRSLGKSPSFAITAVLTLALGIGVNTALFSLYNKVALQPLPLKEPESLVRLSGATAQGRALPGFNFAEYLTYREGSRVLDGLMAYREEKWTLQARAGAARETLFDVGGLGTVPIELVSDNYFDVLGGSIQLGRAFLREEVRAPGGAAVIVLSDSFWESHFQRDPNAIGATLNLGGHICTVIGVATPDFAGQGAVPPAGWVPLTLGSSDPADYGARGPEVQDLVGRLKPGVTDAQARTDLAAIASRRAAEFPADNAKVTVNVKRGMRFINIPRTPEALAQLSPLLLGFAMVLFIACTNVANLLLARGVARQSEIAVRLTLGASRGRIVRQLLTETSLLCVAGATLGLGLGLGLLRFLQLAILGPLLPGVWIEYMKPAIDLRVLAFAATLAVGATLAAGLLPAWHTVRVNLIATVHGEGTAFGRRLTPARLRQILVIAQVGVCLALLSCAGVMARVFFTLKRVDVGFDAEAVYLASVTPNATISDPRAAFQQAMQALKAVPQIDSVAGANSMSFFGRGQLGSIRAAEAAASGNEIGVRAMFITPEFFATFGLPLRTGRTFRELELQSSTRTVIVSESLARRLWPGVEAVGRTLTVTEKFWSSREHPSPDGAVRDCEVIGVARDITMPVQDYSRDAIYLPFALDRGTSALMFVRPRGRSAGTLNEIVHAAEAAGVRVRFERQLSVQLQLAVLPFYVFAVLSGTLGGLALGMAMVGLHGLMSFAVKQRVREIGVRVALGATTKNIVRLFVQQGMKLVGIGLVLGLIGGKLCALLLNAVLFGFIRAFDAWVFATVGLLFALVALFACWLPARRAAKVDPMVALRAE